MSHDCRLFAVGPEACTENCSKWKVLNKKFISLIKALQQTAAKRAERGRSGYTVSMPCCSHTLGYMCINIYGAHTTNFQIGSYVRQSQKAPTLYRAVCLHFPFPILDSIFPPALLLWQLQKTFSLFFKSLLFLSLTLVLVLLFFSILFYLILFCVIFLLAKFLAWL